MSDLKILIDENIPFAREIFSRIGTIRIKSGRDITHRDLDDIDILVARSITKVNEGLLKNTPVKFIGTATIGTDHIDTDYLEKNDIGFTNAAGSNANSVVEYIFSSIYFICTILDKKITELSLGVVGTGNIGRPLAEKAEKLGMTVLRNDPPLEEAGIKEKFHHLNELFFADIISIHTPLTRTGKHATYHLFDDRILNNLSPSTLVINAARGPVIDNNALLPILKDKSILGTVLDVWEEEPGINPELLDKVYLGTPHIAGYSYEGKVNGSVDIFNKVCQYFNLGKNLSPQEIIPAVEDNLIRVIPGKTREQTVYQTIQQAYNIEKDFHDLKLLTRQETAEERKKYFDKLRKEYPRRREFNNYKIVIDKGLDEGVMNDLKVLGFLTG